MSSPAPQYTPQTWLQRLSAIEREHALDPTPLAAPATAKHIANAFQRLRAVGSLLDTFATFDAGEGRRDKWHLLRIRVRGFDALRNAIHRSHGGQDFSAVVARVLDLGKQMRAKAVEFNGLDFE